MGIILPGVGLKTICVPAFLPRMNCALRPEEGGKLEALKPSFQLTGCCVYHRVLVKNQNISQVLGKRSLFQHTPK
jgi:hypothetical protein